MAAPHVENHLSRPNRRFRVTESMASMDCMITHLKVMRAMVGGVFEFKPARITLGEAPRQPHRRGEPTTHEAERRPGNVSSARFEGAPQAQTPVPTIQVCERMLSLS